MPRKKPLAPAPPPPEPGPLAALEQAPTDALAAALQAQLLSVLQGVQVLAARQPVAAKVEWARQMKSLQTALRFLHREHPTDSSESDAQTTIDPARLHEFSQAVRQARKRADLTQVQLAERSGLSEGTIKGIEKASHNPTRETLRCLLNVTELGLDASHLPGQRRSLADFRSLPNCWIAPGYDPIKMFGDLLDLVNSPGGAIEQTFAYLDHRSASHWYHLSNLGEYAAIFRANMPLDAMARRILEHTGRAGLDVLALGAGDGKQEVRLTQHLLDRIGQGGRDHKPGMRLYLLDVSQPLLGEAYKHAAETLGKRAGLYICAVLGNFHNLPQYEQFLQLPEREHRRRIVVMVGNTVGNLDDERKFFRHSLIGFTPGDLLLIHVQLVHAPAEHPNEVRRRDPALVHGLPAGHADWLRGPFDRYCDGVTDVKFEFELDNHCPVPGSYSLDTLATVTVGGRRNRRFSVFRFKRYEAKRLAEFLVPFGWELVEEMPFGTDTASPTHSLLLFRKTARSE